MPDRQPGRAAGLLRVAPMLVVGLLAVSATQASAAVPATSAQKDAMARAVPTVVAKVYPRAPKAFRTCFRLDRESAKRSTRAPAYRFAYVEYRQGRGACASEDSSYGFYAYWRKTPNGLLFVAYTNQAVCLQSIPVPVAVQREAIPNCQVV
jgi:zona occludens toxin (predicted ATPase)